MRFLFLFLILCAGAFAQEPKRPIETLALIDRARALPPEFTADILLRLANSKLIDETKWKRELIEEAFLSGAQAPLPYLQTAGDLATDSRANLLVSHNNLERLTLQTHAVEAMLAIDPQRALLLYQDIVPPAVPRITCQDPVTPDVSAYFATATRIFDRSFTPKQRKNEDDIQFLRLRISQMQSPAHVVPVLKMLHAAGLTPEQRKDLTALFATVLDQVTGSDRVFRTTEGTLVGASLPEWTESGLMVPALRSYIVRQVSGPRCSDSIKPGALPASVMGFNRLIGFLDRTAELSLPITPDEAKPLRDDGTFAKQFSWHSARGKAVLEALRWLNHGNRDLPGDQRFWTLAERSTPEWNARYLDAVKLIEGWQEDEEETPEDYLFTVANTWATLAALVPPGKARDNAIGNWRVFLETHYAATENRNLWFSQVNALLRRAHSATDAKERAWILDELSRSANPIIALYARMELLPGGA